MIRMQKNKTPTVLLAILIAVIQISCSRVEQLAKSIASGELAIQSTRLFPAVVNQNYSNQISVSGGTTPYQFELVSGSLPTGISLDSNLGTLSGMPAANSVGSHDFRIKVTDARGVTIEQNFSLRVSEALVITTNSLPVGQPLTSYAVSISTSGGNPPLTYIASGLPNGISINSSTGIISGTPLSTGNYSVSIDVTDADGLTASKSLTLSVIEPLVFPTATLPIAPIGGSYSETVTATGGLPPYTYSIANGSLPSGLTMDSSGVISGVVQPGANAKTGSFTFTARVTDSLGQQQIQVFTINVAIGPRIIDDLHTPLRTAGVGHAYLDRVKYTGGVGAITFSTTSPLPSGLSLDSTSGFIRGTPQPGSAGTYGLVITATDSNGLTSTVTKNLRVVTSGKSKVDLGAPISTIFNNLGGWAHIYGMETADLNNDGILDIALAADGNSSLYVLLGRGNGMFDWIRIPTTGTRRLFDVQIADLNSDGHLDVIATSVNSQGLMIFAGDSNWTNPNTITQQWIATSGTAIYSFHNPVDVNGDGFLDIVVGQYNASKYQVILNCSSGNTVSYAGNPTQGCNTTGQPIINYHRPTAINAPSGVYDVAMADMNSDGIYDIVGSVNNNTVEILLGNGDGTFQTAVASPTLGSGPRGLRVGDMDGDGFLDVVVTHNTHTISVIRGNGAGGFLSVNNYSNTDMGGNGAFIDLADFDGDGDLDVVVNADATYYVYLWRNNGSGVLTNRIVYRVGANPAGVLFRNMISGETHPQLLVVTYRGQEYPTLNVIPFNESSKDTNPYPVGSFTYAGYPEVNVGTQGAPAIADLNNDGFLDYVVKTQGATQVMLGTADGSFELQLDSIPNGESGVNSWFGRQHIFSDFNGDGIWDYASASWNGGSVGTASVLLGNGDGTFGNQTTFATNYGCTGTNQGARSIDAADINRDGKMDLIVATGCSVSPSAQVYIFLGYGDGTFNTTSPIIVSGNGAYVDYVRAFDVNGDGKADLVLANNNANLQLYIGNGNGTFALPVTRTMSISGNIAQLEEGDFNGDGLYDFVMSTISGSSWSFIPGASGGTSLGTASPVVGFAPSDVNGMTSTTFNGHGLTVADWNDDGRLDVLFNRDRVGLELFLGDNTGIFTTRNIGYTNACAYSHRSGYWLLAAADMNNDGLPDLICANTAANSGANFNGSR